MRLSAKDLLGHGLTLAMVTCAIVATTAVVRRDFLGGQGRALGQPDVPVQNWSELIGPAHMDVDVEAIVTLLVFSDFQCPACRQFHQNTLRQLRSAFSESELRIGYRHWPLPYHQFAMDLALTSECVGEQGRFFEFADVVFAGQDSLGKIPALEFARRSGVMDVEPIRLCVKEPRVVARVEEDQRTIESLDGRGTPAILLEGVLLGAVPGYDELHKRVRGLLDKQQS